MPRSARPHAAPDGLRPGAPRPAHPAQPHHQGGHLRRGVTPGGTVSDELVDFHRRVAAGGRGHDHRGLPRPSRPRGGPTATASCSATTRCRGCAGSTDAVHAEGAAAAAQIGHAGPVANAALQRAPALSPSRRLHAHGHAPARRRRAPASSGSPRTTAGAAGAGRGGGLRQHRGARRAQLPAQRLPEPQAQPPRRPVRRSVENRARFARTVLRTVRDAAGRRSGGDGQAEHGRRGRTAACGSTRASRSPGSSRPTARSTRWSSPAGSSLANPMYLFRGEAPLREFGATLPPPVRLGFRFIGHRFLRAYPYEEAFFLPYARQFQRRAVHARSSCSAASPSWRRSRRPWPRGSPSWPWPGPSCASPTCRTACRRARRPRPRCASTATSACPPSTRGPAASW